MKMDPSPFNLLAINEIKSLKARYFRFVDTKDWVGLATLFTPDATMFFPEQQSEPVSAAKAIEFIAQALDGGISIHHGHMPEIEILTPTSARGIWAMEDRIFWPSDRVSTLGLVELQGYGHYHEDYRKVNEVWLMQSFKLTRLYSRTYTPPVRVD